VNKYTYNFEIKDLLTQFIAAFDDTVIKRYDKQRQSKQDIEVRYVFAPKQRVMYDIVNKAQNITLPVVAIDLKSVSYDDSRVFNKVNSIENYIGTNSSLATRMPVPVNLSVSMSIIGKYMQDVEQIISNFVPYTNPYIILAWKEPTNTDRDIEIRTEVLWDKTISLNAPTELASTDKFRVAADTSFTIKGWLFKSKSDTSTPIYFIDQNFITTTKGYNLTEPLTSTNYSGLLLELEDVASTETYRISGTPSITNIYYNNSGSLIEAYNPITLNKAVSAYQSYSYTIVGNNFNRTNLVLLSSNNTTLTNNITTIDTKYTGSATGFIVPSSNIVVLTDEVMNITIPYLSGSGDVDIIVNNPAGWTSSRSISGFYFIA
jgi:hypothetical protein